MKDFLIKEIAITDSFGLPIWAFIAAGVAVILAVIVIVSAVKNSKKASRKKAEEEQAQVTEIAETEEPVEVAPSEEVEEPIVSETAEEIPEETVEPVEVEEAEAETEEVAADEEETEEIPEKEEENDEEEIAAEEEPTETEEVEETEAETEDVADDEEEAEEPETEEEVEETPEEPEEVEKAEPVKEEEPEETYYVSRRERMAEKANENATSSDAVTFERKEPKKTAKPVAEEKPEKKQNKATTKKKEEPMKDKKETKETATKDVKTAAKKEAAKPVEKAPAAKKETAKPVEKAPAAKKEAAKPVDEKKAVGKFEVVRSVLGGYRYLLIANNGQLLYRSTEYKTLDGCKSAIAGFVNSVKNGNFKVRGDKFKNFKFNLQSATSNNIVYIGEAYSTQAACEKGVESVKRFAPVSPVIDVTDDDSRMANSVLFEIPKDIRDAVAAKTGAQGRWEIAATEADGNGPFAYFLYANNGQLLYESREYTTFAGAKSAITPFLKNLQEGKFIIDKDKFGKFKFILSAMNSPVDYVGQSYNDKNACQNSAISVYKFALLTPVDIK